MPEDRQINAVSCNNKNDSLIITYAGGLHYNRWKTLSMLGKAIHNYNNNHTKKVRLNIYSQKTPDKEILDSLSISDSCSFMGSLTSEQVNDVLLQSDLVVHVESFDEEDIEATRLSFSTKIYEYMASGKPLLAIGPQGIASIEYLQDCSFCVTNISDITDSLVERIANKRERELIVNKCAEKYTLISKSEHSKDRVIRAIMECNKDDV